MDGIVGAVQVVLSARDAMTPELVKAAESVQQLRITLKGLPEDAVPAIQSTVRSLVEAEAAFEKLWIQAAESSKATSQAATAIGSIGPAAGSSAARLNELTAATERGVAASKAQAQAEREATTAIEARAAAATAANTRAEATAAAAGFTPVAGSPLGAVSPVMAAQLNATTQEVEALGAAAAGKGAEGINKLRIATEEGGKSMAQFEGLATRLMERMILLFVLKESFDFVKEVIEANSQLVELHERTGRSIDDLRLMQFEAEQTSVPFSQVAGSIEKLNKTLGDSKEITSAVLGSLGIDVEKFFASSPDEKWNTLATAIGSIADPMKRASIEAQLGIEALDPLIVGMDKFKSQFDGLAKVTDEQTEAIHRLATAFVGLWAAAKGQVAREIGNTVIGFEAVFFGKVPGLSGADPGNTGLGRALLAPDRGKGLDLFPGFNSALGGSNNFDSSAGTAKDIEMSRYHSNEWGEKGLDVKQMMEDAKKSSSEMLDWQKRYDAALEKHIEIVDGANSADINWRETLKGIEGRTPPFEANYLTGQQTIDRAKKDLLGGMSASNVAAELDLYPEQVKAIQAELKDEEATLKLLTKSVNMATEEHVVAIEKLGQTYQNLNGQVVPILSSDTIYGSHPFEASGTNLPSSHGIIGLMPDLGDAAKQRINDARYTFADEFGDIPKIMEEAFSSSGSSGKAISKIAAKVGQDFAHTMGIEITVGLGHQMSLIGASVFQGISLGASDSSFADRLMGSMSGGFGAGAKAFESSGGKWGKSLAAGMESGLIEFGVQAVTAAIMHIFRDRTPEDIARDAGKFYGGAFSDGLIKEITARADAELPDALQSIHDTAAKKYGRAGRPSVSTADHRGEQAAELLSLADIINENPIDTSNVEMYEARVHDLFSMIEEGKLTVQEAAGILNKVFPDLAESATDSFGRISDALKEVIALNDKFGTQSKAIADWRKAQGANVASGASAVASYLPFDELHRIGDEVTAAQKAIDDWNADPKNRFDPNSKVPKEMTDRLDRARDAQAGVRSGGTVTKEMLGDVGNELIGGFVTELATGTSRGDALKSESQALTDLEKSYKDLGIEVTDAGLKQLFMQNNMMKAAPTLIAGVDGLTKSMVGQDNLGIETVATFQEQERTGYAMYVRLQDAAAKLGGGTKDALLPMQDYLHQAEIEAKKLGVPLDDNTQQMINQSKELGIWDDKAGGAVNPTKLLADAIAELVKWLKGIPPNVHSDVTTDITVNTKKGNDYDHGPFNYDGSHDYDGDPTNSLWRGGVVGGPKGTDTVPAWLTPGEGVVNTAGMKKLGAGGLAALNSGGGQGGVTIHIELNATGILDAAGLIPIVHDHVIPAITKALDNNRMGIRTVMRESLRVA